MALSTHSILHSFHIIYNDKHLDLRSLKKRYEVDGSQPTCHADAC